MKYLFLAFFLFVALGPNSEAKRPKTIAEMTAFLQDNYQIRVASIGNNDGKDDPCVKAQLESWIKSLPEWPESLRKVPAMIALYSNNVGMIKDRLVRDDTLNMVQHVLIREANAPAFETKMYNAEGIINITLTKASVINEHMWLYARYHQGLSGFLSGTTYSREVFYLPYDKFMTTLFSNPNDELKQLKIISAEDNIHNEDGQLIDMIKYYKISGRVVKKGGDRCSKLIDWGGVFNFYNAYADSPAISPGVLANDA